MKPRERGKPGGPGGGAPGRGGRPDDDAARPERPSHSEADGSTAKPATRAVVVVPESRQPEGRGADGEPPEPRRRTAAEQLAEAVGLAQAIGLEVAETLIAPLRKATPATLLGGGKVEEIAAILRVAEAELVVVDHPLTPVQQRNLETAWSAKVLDRTGLILEIFGERARTKEGKLQVELAHLNYQRSRLVRSWTHLERQRGGFGFLGGPGETQIEADRRQIDTRIRKIEGQLEGVRNMRAVHRSERSRVPRPIVALVGYTNAGKSTLFNRLTGAGVVAVDQVFATLDPTLRRIRLPHGEEAILSDTVGFISELPTTLVAAFRATLEEVLEADIILHVRDIASPESAQQAADVAGVLAELGIPPGADPRLLEVWNKADKLDDAQREALSARASAAAPPAVLISAETGEGMEPLLAAIEARLLGGRAVLTVGFEPAQLHAARWLYENAEVLTRDDDAETGQARLTVRLAESRMTPFRDWARRERVAVEAAGGARTA